MYLYGAWETYLTVTVQSVVLEHGEPNKEHHGRRTAQGFNGDEYGKVASHQFYEWTQDLVVPQTSRSHPPTVNNKKPMSAMEELSDSVVEERRRFVIIALHKGMLRTGSHDIFRTAS